jgi:hypothetical protein
MLTVNRLGLLGILRSQFGFPRRIRLLVQISSKSDVKQLESVIQLDKSSDNHRLVEINGITGRRSAAYLYLGYAVNPKIVFP